MVNGPVFQKTNLTTTQLPDNLQHLSLHNSTFPSLTSLPHSSSSSVSVSLAQCCHPVTYSLAGHHSPTFRSALENVFRLEAAGVKGEISSTFFIPCLRAKVFSDLEVIHSLNIPETPSHFFAVLVRLSLTSTFLWSNLEQRAVSWKNNRGFQLNSANISHFESDHHIFC